MSPELIDDVCECTLEDDELELLVGEVADVGVDVERLHAHPAAVARHEPRGRQPELLLQTQDEPLGGVRVGVKHQAPVTGALGCQSHKTHVLWLDIRYLMLFLC